MLSNLAKAIN
jgi:hypothetical protein